MKQKDIIYLLLAVVILLVAGYIAYTQILPQQASSKAVEVETVGPVPSQMNAQGLERLGDAAKVKDYGSPVDLGGLGNKNLFGQ